MFEKQYFKKAESDDPNEPYGRKKKVTQPQSPSLLKDPPFKKSLGRASRLPWENVPQDKKDDTERTIRPERTKVIREDNKEITGREKEQIALIESFEDEVFNLSDQLSKRKEGTAVWKSISKKMDLLNKMKSILTEYKPDLDGDLVKYLERTIESKQAIKDRYEKGSKKFEFYNQEINALTELQIKVENQRI